MAGRRKPAGIGHNSEVFAHTLRAAYRRLKQLNDEIKEVNAQKSEVYKEARAVGVDLRVLGMILSRDQQDRTEVRQRDAEIAKYEAIVHGLEADEADEEAS